MIHLRHEKTHVTQQEWERWERTRQEQGQARPHGKSRSSGGRSCRSGCFSSSSNNLQQLCIRCMQRVFTRTLAVFIVAHSAPLPPSFLVVCRSCHCPHELCKHFYFPLTTVLSRICFLIGITVIMKSPIGFADFQCAEQSLQESRDRDDEVTQASARMTKCRLAE